VTTYGAARAAARAALAARGIDSAALDARLLLAAAAGLDMAALIARANDELPDLAERRFAAHLRRRLDGEPVARILGEKEFWGLSFEVNEATLLPRPDTETLVEAVVAEARRSLPPSISICDLGTGCGAILIALLTELPQAHGIGTDLSEDALAAARRNAEQLGVGDRIAFRCVDFTKGPDDPFDVVVSNPPYIPSGAIQGLAREVRDFDPLAALDGGHDGLAAYRAILARADRLLAAGGLLAFEVGHDQGEAVAALCRAAGIDDVAVVGDLAGIGRVVVGRRDASGSGRMAAKKALGKVHAKG
jgi:release factor glutamine methyltransferase